VKTRGEGGGEGRRMQETAQSYD